MSTKSSNESQSQGTHEEDGSDSFDRLLREVARPSMPSPRSSALLHPGTTLVGGRLSVVRRIGEGGMGVVYEAHDAQRKSRVALKTLTRVDAAGVYRLKNEFRALADVRHENLVALHELFAAEETWFFTMDLIDGQRFDHFVRPDAGALDEVRLRAALPQLTAAVNAVHAAGKLHRDLKPSNVLVTPEGRVVVLDFGLSVDPELGGVGQTLADDSVSGTPAYMAPEQAAGIPASTESDFYAIGAMLFEALTGRLPFEGRAGEIIAAKQNRAAPRASALQHDVPADLDALCAGLLAREPAMRRDAIAACNALAAGAEPSRQPPPAAARDAAPSLIGRDAELATLHAAFAAMLSGRPVALFVAGESGIGKSALVAAFLDELRVRGSATLLTGRCYERENVPYKGFDALVDELSRQLRKLPMPDAAALLPREMYALARLFPVLDRVPVVADAPKKAVPDPQDLKQRAFAAFGEMLGRMRDRAPLVLVIDDLQWIDQDSVRLMRALLVQPDPAPVLLVCVHRSEGAEHNALLQAVVQGAQDNIAIDVRSLALSPLPKSALRVLAARLLPSGTDPITAEAFAAEAQGSPFFAAELARAAPLHAGGAKLSLAQALALHVASLPAEAQRLLSLLALAGQPLSPQLAVDAAELSDGHAQLDRLRSEQLVRVSFDGDGARRIECYHDKIREHASAALDTLRTRELALGLSRALLADAEADPELLARVLTLAELRAEAAQHAARAAERAFAGLAFERAAALYAQALDAGRFEPERQSALRVAKAEALAHAGHGARAAEAFLEAASQAQALDAVELEYRAADQYLLSGDLQRGRALLARTLPRFGIPFQRSIIGTVASIVWSRVRLRWRGLRYTPRKNHDPATLRKLDRLRDLTHALVRSDQVRAADYSARWLLCALDAGHEVEIGRALAWELMVASTLEAPEARIREIEKLCISLAETTGDFMMRCWFGYCMGIHEWNRSGDAATALARFERTSALANANPISTSSYDAAWLQCWRALALLGLGRLREAGEIAQAALEHAVARGDQTVIPPLVVISVSGALAADRPEQAARFRDLATPTLPLVELTLKETYSLSSQPLPDLYRGDANAAWARVAEPYAAYGRSFQGRFIHARAVGAYTCGMPAAAAMQAKDPVARLRLQRAAERLARQGVGATVKTVTTVPEAVLACLNGDRSAAIAAVRARLAQPQLPFVATGMRRRLGELLGDEEGAKLIAEADAALRAGGVVDPARLVAAMVPGVELPSEAKRP